MFKNQQFYRPPVTHTRESALRKVGFEIEFNGISINKAVDIVQSCYGGEINNQSKVQKILKNTQLGDFVIELDWDFLKRKAIEKNDEKAQTGWVDYLSEYAQMIVPIEIVCPPVAIDKLSQLNLMINSLQESGATGTDDLLIAAYGVHINPELPEISPAVILAYLKAFALLQWWLVDAHQVDLTRKITPFIDLYPQIYLRKVLTRKECTFDDIFQDYLEHNATRNRALDLLPLLAEIDLARVRNKVKDNKIKPRPTFHYRMPNCHIGNKYWCLADSWNTWCVIENLANRPQDLKTLSKKFLDAYRPVIGVSKKDWVKFINIWLKENGLIIND